MTPRARRGRRRMTKPPSAAVSGRWGDVVRRTGGDRAGAVVARFLAGSRQRAIVPLRCLFASASPIAASRPASSRPTDRAGPAGGAAGTRPGRCPALELARGDARRRPGRAQGAAGDGPARHRRAQASGGGYRLRQTQMSTLRPATSSPARRPGKHQRRPTTIASRRSSPRGSTGRGAATCPR